MSFERKPWHRRTAGQLTIAFFISMAGAAALLPLRKPRIPLEHSNTTLAVLPLNNLSPAQVQPYFSDGLAAEIADRLTRFDDLGVAAANSSLTLAQTTADLRTVADKLGVNRVLQGSVQGMGDSLQLSLQLLDASNGAQLWSKNYDTSYDHVFDTEEKIAKDVGMALRLKPVMGLSRRTLAGTTNLEAHELYLQALELRRQGTLNGLTKALGLLHETAAIDPDFALAWAAQFDAFHRAMQLFPEQAAAAHKELVEASDQLQALAPAAPATYTALARLHAADHRWAEAEIAAKHAIGVSSPWDANVAQTNGLLALALGRANDALMPLKLARDADPLNQATSNTYQLALAIHLRDAKEAAGTPATAEASADKNDILASLQQLPTQPGADLTMLWFPYDTTVRSDPRFKQILRELQLPDYFRSSGRWNDFCHPAGAEDFECE